MIAILHKTSPIKSDTKTKLIAAKRQGAVLTASGLQNDRVNNPQASLAWLTAA
jgi:hypothetical protein